MKIVVFDKYLGYQVGGAQNSLHTLLKNLKGDFEFLGCDVKKAFSAEKYRLSDWSVERMAIKEFPRFPYFEYWYNRKRIKKFIASHQGDLLLTQGMWGAMAIKAFSGKSVYFIRDEYHFNQVPVYQKGIKKFLKILYIFSQSFFIRSFFKDNTEAAKKADLLVANSKYMAGKLEELFKRSADFIYPLMDLESFSKNIVPSAKERKYLVLMGAEIIKGRGLVEEIANIMPDHQFMIVGREFSQPIQKDNVLYHPWSVNPLNIYKQAKIILSASIIDSAIPRTGRVGPEANALGIPCISSKIGDVKDYLHDEFFIDDRENIQSWKNKILEVENKIDSLSEKLKQKALEYDVKKQVAKFRMMVKEKLNFDL